MSNESGGSLRSPRENKAGDFQRRSESLGNLHLQAGIKSVKKVTPKYVIVSRDIVDHKFFIVFTSILTLYALLGDDIRILCTEKTHDTIFDVLVIMCIAIFGAEVILSCLGKYDYFLGFFFILDVFSTLSLVLDLTFVADEIAKAIAEGGGSDGDDNASNMRSGKTAKLGARAGRVVRVLRLVRILKLYKAYYEASRRKRMEEARRMNENHDDEWNDDDDMEKDERWKQSSESRVGRKLSEMTTRRVICLILAMLLVLPLLRTEQANQTAFSASYGADNVWQAFNRSQNGEGTFKDYEEAMLQYVYYHNWFAARDKDTFCSSGACANEYYGHLFWVGITGNDKATVQQRQQDAKLSPSTVAEWTSKMAEKTDGIYNYGTFPDQAKELLSSEWSDSCDSEDCSCASDNYLRRGVSLLQNEIDGVFSHPVGCPHKLRPSETVNFSPRLMTSGQFDAWHFTFFFDLRPYLKADAWWNLIVTVFIMLLLVLGSLIFSHDANRLVLNPVEKMITRVEAIREDPLIAMKMADDEFLSEEVAKAKLRRTSRAKKILKDIVMCDCNNNGKELMETVILEKAIIKLGSLLALGFGEAGANIIGQNMSGQASSGVNAMIPGTRVECIMGVVRVRHFSTATEVLQSKIMTFGNQIAEIIHGVCNEFFGAPNKNNGDTFLVIWRFDETQPCRNSRMAEMSVVAFATILGSLHGNPLLATYRDHPGLQNRFNRLGTNGRVNLSFGLHAGWAIEGAVGSEFKIDASYLSPNLSIATSIEQVTGVYGVSFMVAQSVVELCGKAIASKCRLIDRVVITGSKTPMELYCVDLDYMNVKVDEQAPLDTVWNTRQRFKVRQFMEAEKQLILKDSLDLAAKFDTTPTIAVMRKPYTVEFFQLFNMGYQNYTQGEWSVARRMLSCTRSLLGVEDGPSHALLRYMEVPHQFTAPKDWVGVRELPRWMAAA